MKEKKWQDVIVSPSTSLAQAIAKIDASSLQIALVLNTDYTLAGILTDGDIRRAILNGKSLDTSVVDVMNRQPTAASVSMSRSKMLALMRQKVIHQLPLIDSNQRVVGLITLDELIGAVDHPNWVVIMAGGLGKRLYPLTAECPKPLLSIGGKPILEIIIENFAAEGFKNIFISVNYKAEMIQEYVGQGDLWGVHITYLHEKERLGTAGALSLLPTRPTLPIIVMNADILTQANFQNLLQFHQESAAVATMAVREYDFQVPYGVVHVSGAKIEGIEEKPIHQFFINGGIYVLSPQALNYLPQKTFFDMPTLFQHLIANQQLTAAYPLREYWLDIGRISDLEKANQEIRMENLLT